MFNSRAPGTDDLPSSAQLLKSTIISGVAPVATLVTIVLPSEHAVDPTGIGSGLGLTEMAESKTQLAEEAEMDRLTEYAPRQPMHKRQHAGMRCPSRCIRAKGRK